MYAKRCCPRVYNMQNSIASINFFFFHFFYFYIRHDISQYRHYNYKECFIFYISILLFDLKKKGARNRCYLFLYISNECVSLWCTVYGFYLYILSVRLWRRKRLCELEFYVCKIEGNQMIVSE